MKIVLIAHYYPPLNSSGAKRVEALSKYWVAFGHEVTVITPVKTSADGDFTEVAPPGVHVVELDWRGRDRRSVATTARFEPMYTGKPTWKRRLKDGVMNLLGQIPDPRLPFALAFIYPWLSRRAKTQLKNADIVIASTPPWPSLLAGLISKWRFDTRLVLDYRDHFSECHEMPGGPFAKWLEKVIDRRLVRAADHLVCISEPMSQYYATLGSRVTTILNGYDHELLDMARLTARPQSECSDRIYIRYMGIVSPGRVPHNILQALVKLRKLHPEMFRRLRVQFFGNAALIAQAIDETYTGIGEIFDFFEAVPYLDSLQKIAEADYLLFSETSSKKTLSAQGILTTKLFEYIGSGRPVLADISRDTLAGDLLGRCGAQHVIGQTSELFLSTFQNPDFYRRPPDIDSPIRTSLSRKSQASQYEALLLEIVNTK
jgi:glycosyltransferase involved in cell wall biosynthesis